MAETDDAFKITPPHWIKDSIVGVFKWGPHWVMIGVLLWFMWMQQQQNQARENTMFNTIYALTEPIHALQQSMEDHMGTSSKTQLFISVMCANNANNSAQRRACFDDYYARQMKERETER